MIFSSFFELKSDFLRAVSGLARVFFSFDTELVLVSFSGTWPWSGPASAAARFSEASATDGYGYGGEGVCFRGNVRPWEELPGGVRLKLAQRRRRDRRASDKDDRLGGEPQVVIEPRRVTYEV